jgi:hypothetical protein
MLERAVRGQLFIIYNWIVILYHITDIKATGFIGGMSQ